MKHNTTARMIQLQWAFVGSRMSLDGYGMSIFISMSSRNMQILRLSSIHIHLLTTEPVVDREINFRRISTRYGGHCPFKTGPSITNRVLLYKESIRLCYRCWWRNNSLLLRRTSSKNDNCTTPIASALSPEIISTTALTFNNMTSTFPVPRTH